MVLRKGGNFKFASERGGYPEKGGGGFPQKRGGSNPGGNCLLRRRHFQSESKQERYKY